MLLNSFAVAIVKENATTEKVSSQKPKSRKTTHIFVIHSAIITKYINFDKVNNTDLTCTNHENQEAFTH